MLRKLLRNQGGFLFQQNALARLVVRRMAFPVIWRVPLADSRQDHLRSQAGFHVQTAIGKFYA